MEERELEYLGSYAFFSKNATRQHQEKKRKIDYRTQFQHDRDRIIHSKYFRLLKHKSQIFPSPLLAQYSTRLTHTLEVAQIARTISRTLHLNEDLTEAIALGHDLGHSPFGHAGEKILRELMLERGKTGFEHNEQSLRVVDKLEKMNLTYQVRQGILLHTRFENSEYAEYGGREIPEELKKLEYCSKEDRETTDVKNLTLEAQVVDISDEIAYLTHDLDDCERAGILKITEVPQELREFIGSAKRDAINRLVTDVVKNADKQFDEYGLNPQEIRIEYGDTLFRLTEDLKKFFEDEIFEKDEIKRRLEQAQNYLNKMFDFYMENINDLEDREKNVISTSIKSGCSNEEAVLDLIVSKTDQEIIADFEKVFVPKYV